MNMESKIPISAVVVVKDAEKNIADCLESVKWMDEIVVVDDYSSDRTVGIASKYTNKIFQRKAIKDGFIGFMVAFYSGLYQVITYAKYWEIKSANK